MSDDPKKKKEDSPRVSQQKHEVDYLKKKFSYVTKEEVREYIKELGPTREEVEKALHRLDTRRRNAR